MAFAWQATGIAAPFGDLGDPGPGLVPMALGIAMAVLGVVLVLRAGPSGDGGPAERDPAAGDVAILPPPPVWVRLAVAACVLGFVYGFERLGFTLSSFLFLAAAMFLLGDRGPRGLAVSAVAGLAASFAIGWMLTTIMGVPLPGVFRFG